MEITLIVGVASSIRCLQVLPQRFCFSAAADDKPSIRTNKHDKGSVSQYCHDPLILLLFLYHSLDSLTALTIDNLSDL